MEKPDRKARNNKKDEQEEKPKKGKGNKEGKDQEGKKPERPATFARRNAPTMERPYAKWLAIRDVFEQHVQQRLTKHSSYQDTYWLLSFFPSTKPPSTFSKWGPPRVKR